MVPVCSKYACRRCEHGVTQTQAPAWLIAGGLPTQGMITHFLVAKYADLGYCNGLGRIDG